MVQDKARNQSVALKVGMPLEGDQASWTLVEVKPRSVVFRSAANETHRSRAGNSVAAAAQGPRSRAARARVASTGAAAATRRRERRERQAARCERDLAKRIEERRTPDARRCGKAAQQQGGKATPPPKSPAPPKK